MKTLEFLEMLALTLFIPELLMIVIPLGIAVFVVWLFT